MRSNTERPKTTKQWEVEVDLVVRAETPQEAYDQVEQALRQLKAVEGYEIYFDTIEKTHD